MYPFSFAYRYAGASTGLRKLVMWMHWIVWEVYCIVFYVFQTHFKPVDMAIISILCWRILLPWHTIIV